MRYVAICQCFLVEIVFFCLRLVDASIHRTSHCVRCVLWSIEKEEFNLMNPFRLCNVDKSLQQHSSGRKRKENAKKASAGAARARTKYQQQKVFPFATEIISRIRLKSLAICTLGEEAFPTTPVFCSFSSVVSGSHPLFCCSYMQRP